MKRDYVNTHDWNEAEGRCLRCSATDTSKPCDNQPPTAQKGKARCMFVSSIGSRCQAYAETGTIYCEIHNGKWETPTEKGKHTEGPWYFEPESETIRVREWKRNAFMGDYRGCIIASFEQSHGGEYRRDSIEGLKESIEANAHLIAAAPAMYEALKVTLEAHGACDGNGCFCSMARAALRSADRDSTPQT